MATVGFKGLILFTNNAIAEFVPALLLAITCTGEIQ